jgi:hypothetical protein
VLLQPGQHLGQRAAAHTLALQLLEPLHHAQLDLLCAGLARRLRRQDVRYEPARRHPLRLLRLREHGLGLLSG